MMIGFKIMPVPFPKTAVCALFELADFKVTAMTETTNKYWGTSFVYDSRIKVREAISKSPWWLVQTDTGCIHLGWRKNVFSISWEHTDFKGIITEDEVTKEDQLVHANNYVKALEYLTELRKQMYIHKENQKLEEKQPLNLTSINE